jgi:probable rRNA maturation factor
MKKDEGNFSVNYLTKKKLLGGEAVFRRIKEFVLGENYRLSLNFIGSRLSKELNRTYRGRNKATAVLSFALDKDEGEIFINRKEASAEAGKFSRRGEDFVIFLFIHSLCHLKGLRHGVKMENAEKKLREKFSV